jgi:hypothetical protein
MLVMIPDSSHNGKINIEIVVSEIIPCYPRYLLPSHASAVVASQYALYHALSLACII